MKEAAHTVARSKAQETDRTRPEEGAKTLPDHPHQGKAGTPAAAAPEPAASAAAFAKSDAENLHEAFTGYETEILRLTQNPEVAFTNNRSERDIRMAKVEQKVSGCFRSPKYAAAHCRISSYLKSMAYKGYNPRTAIQIALCGNAEETIGNLPIVPAKGA